VIEAAGEKVVPTVPGQRLIERNDGIKIAAFERANA